MTQPWAELAQALLSSFAQITYGALLLLIVGVLLIEYYFNLKKKLINSVASDYPIDIDEGTN